MLISTDAGLKKRRITGLVRLSLNGGSRLSASNFPSSLPASPSAFLFVNLRQTPSPSVGERVEIELSDVGYRKSGQEILSGVSLKIRKGDFVTVIGPNGAGKSTLLKIMAGVLRPTAGSLFRRKGFSQGFVPQKFALNPMIPMRVRDFLALGVKPSARRRNAAFDFLKPDALESKMLASLSGGELQRVLLARAVTMKPDVLFVDEPAQNLDLKSQFKMYEEIETLRRKLGFTLVMISHDLHFVMSGSSHVVCLYRHICCQGTPEKVTRETSFVDIFGKEMERSMSVYAHRHSREPAE